MSADTVKIPLPLVLEIEDTGYTHPIRGALKEYDVTLGGNHIAREFAQSAEEVAGLVMTALADILRHRMGNDWAGHYEGCYYVSDDDS